MSAPRVAATVAVLCVVALVFYAGSRRGFTPTGSNASIGSPSPPRGPGFRFLAPKVRWSFPPLAGPGQNKRVVVTGGAGFIGSQLGFFLFTQGFDVVLIDNLKFGYLDNLDVNGTRFGTFIEADILDKRVWSYLQKAYVVFHFAALSALPVCQSRPQEAMEVNVGGVAALLEASRLLEVRRFVFASTSAVYENSQPGPDGALTEDTEIHPHLVYSLTKHQAELTISAFAKTYDLDTVILRFFNVYGPHQDFRRLSPPFTSYIVRELLRGRRSVLHGTGTQSRDYVHVDDLMRLAVLVMDHPNAAGKTFNVASGKSYSVNEMYDIVAKHVGRSDIRPVYKEPKNFWGAYKELFEGKRPIKLELLIKEVNKSNKGSYAAAKSVLGWEPRVSMEDGLLGLVTYMRAAMRSLGNSSAGPTAW